jgi:hypothetical protein
VRSGKGFEDFIHSRLELGQGKRLLHIGQRTGILAHRLVVLDTAPLSIHGDLRAIEAAVKGGGNETPDVSYRGLGRADEQFEELLLICGVDGEDVDESNELMILGNGSHCPSTPDAA